LPVRTKDGKLNENYVLLTKENIIKYFKLEERYKASKEKEMKKKN